MIIYTEWFIMRMIVLFIYQKKKRILFKNIKKLQKKEKNKISNLKCWKSKNILLSRQIFKEIWWQVKIFRNKAEKKTDETDKNYIILIRIKNHLQSEINSIMTCINKKLRKVSQIRKVKKKASSRTVIKCIRSINKLTSTNWAKLEEWWLRKNVYWNKWRLIWDSLTRNKKA